MFRFVFFRIISVDISPAWPEKKLFLTGSADGSVKQWGLEKVQGGTKIKALHLLDLHQIEKEVSIKLSHTKRHSFYCTQVYYHSKTNNSCVPLLGTRSPVRMCGV